MSGAQDQAQPGLSTLLSLDNPTGQWFKKSEEYILKNIKHRNMFNEKSRNKLNRLKVL